MSVATKVRRNTAALILKTHGWPASHGLHTIAMLEAGVGIEPAYADLQSAA